MLEWYRAHGRYELLMADCMAVVACAAQATASRQFQYRGRSADPFAEPERITVAQAFERHAGIDLAATLRPEEPDRRLFATMAIKAGVYVPPQDSWGDIFSRVLVEAVEPQLGNGRATILDEYPAVMSALARPKPSNARVAERFEIYLCGVEIANGCAELTDPVEQRRRLVAEMEEKDRIYGEDYPIDEDFIAALRAVPPSSGVALGFDRLVMLATGATRIDQVMWTPVEEP
jgi:lysyl-tRNA synthetase class 2